MEIASCPSVLVALSGGLDSTVLLHSLVELSAQSKVNFRLRALHVNHQLQDRANEWQLHCAALCQQLNIEFNSIAVDVATISGVENAAREARYQAFREALKTGEVLLLAHHRDDQMETLLLRLMRGSGSRGLSGIPRSRELGKGTLLRPLLGFDRQDLLLYAKHMQLKWIEDHSNRDENHDRNYCRHSVLPLIESRWPGYRESWNKAALLAQESESLMQELASLDLALVSTACKSIVDIDKILILSEPRRRNLLRHWLAGLGLPELGWNRLQQLSKEVLLGSASSRFMGPGFQLQRYKNRLYALQPDEFSSETAEEQLQQAWDASRQRERPLANNGSLCSRQAEGRGVSVTACTELKIRYRRGGEYCQLSGRPSKSLKKILQEVDMEPWLRDRMPLLYSGDDLVCIPGVGVSENFAAKAGEPGMLLEWNRPKLMIRV